MKIIMIGVGLAAPMNVGVVPLLRILEAGITHLVGVIGTLLESLVEYHLIQTMIVVVVGIIMTGNEAIAEVLMTGSVTPVTTVMVVQDMVAPVESLTLATVVLLYMRGTGIGPEPVHQPCRQDSMAVVMGTVIGVRRVTNVTVRGMCQETAQM